MSANSARIRMIVHEVVEASDRAGCDTKVRVENKNVRGRRGLESLIHRGGESAVPAILDEIYTVSKCQRPP
jgi:hypothetical protein